MSNDSNSILPFTVNLLTIVMSGVVAAVVTSVLNSRREERRYRREWLEKLCKNFMGFSNDLAVNWMNYVPVMKGELDYDSALDAVIKQGANPERLFKELEMLTTIYWPQADPFVDELKSIRSRGSAVLVKHKRRYLEGMTVDCESFDELASCMTALDDLERRFQCKARELAKSVKGH